MKHVVHPIIYAGLGYEQRQTIVMINTFEGGELDCILEVVLSATQVTGDEFFSPSRQHDLVVARMLFICACRDLLWHRLKLIGAFLNKHHSTIIHNYKKAQDLCQVDKHFRSNYHRCMDLAADKLTKHGFDHKRQAELIRSRVKTSRGRDGSTTHRLVFTQASSR
jgi:hypothetical protein